MQYYGLFLGLFVVVLAGMINGCTFIFIYQAAEFTNQPTYIDIVKTLLGNRATSIFRWIIMGEQLSVALLYSIASWNLF